jgi:Family of unknown function (DUF7033)
VSSVQVMPEAENLLGGDARTYGLRQLARRAGVSAEWFRSWRIEHQAGRTVVFPFAERRQHIRFNHGSHEYWRDLRRGHFSVAHARWPDGPTPEQSRYVPDFVVPFSEGQTEAPLFRLEDGQAEFAFDLLTSTVLTLSRYEETLSGPRDRHDRFPAESSMALQHGFGTRPVVDEFGVAFRYALQRLFPGWQPQPRQFWVNLTHDVDEIGIPFKARLAARRSVRGGASTCVRELVAGFGGRPTALAAVLDTVSLARRRNLRSSVYWKASPAGDFDSGYDLRDPRVDEVIQDLAQMEVELGVHPGYDTYLNREALAQEIGRLRKALGPAVPLGGRQHFLRWSPQTWQDWEACGLGYDSSVGFSECVGFRAGTCYPYRPWLLDQGREAELLEIPLIAMDCTLTGPMGLRGDQCLEPLRKLAETCQAVGGVFTLLWHTDSILEPVYGEAYPRILDLLAGKPSFDWRTALAEGYA